VLGVIDTYGIELLHLILEGRSPQQIGRKGVSNHRWIVGGKLCLLLNVVALRLPPLRDRREDIPGLVAHFLAHYCREVHRLGLEITPAALALLQSYAWPGNVREFQNAIERAVVLTPGPALTETDFPPEIRQATAGAVAPVAPLPRRADILPLADALVAFKRAKVRQALARAQGNHRQAAKLLGIEPSNLSRLLHTLQIPSPPRG